MTNIEELLNIKLGEDKYKLAEITIAYTKRMMLPAPDWAINAREEGRRKAAQKAAESVVVDRGASVGKKRKRAVRRSEDD